MKLISCNVPCDFDIHDIYYFYISARNLWFYKLFQNSKVLEDWNLVPIF